MSTLKVREAVKELQGKGYLTLGIILEPECLASDRFTTNEVTEAIAHINDFGEGFGDISAYALTQFDKYMEETYGAAAEARKAVMADVTRQQLG